MQHINETALRLALVDNLLIAKFYYTWEDDFVLDKEQTYGNTIEEDLNVNDQTSIFLHDLNEQIIRQSSIKLNENKHQAINATSFFSIFKSEESIAKFNLTLLPYPISIIISCAKGHEDAVKLPDLPVIFQRHMHFKYIPIEPVLLHMDYNPRSKDLSLTMGYKPDPINTILIHYGDSHAAQLKSFRKTHF